MIVTLGPVQERAWLIQVGRSHLFWSVVEGWVDDTIRATRFAREQDAREVAAFAGLSRTNQIVVSEHVWAEAQKSRRKA